MWLETLAQSNPETDAGIDELISCNAVSIRYALLTHRTDFLTLVGEELNERITQPAHKLAGQDSLRSL